MKARQFFLRLFTPNAEKTRMNLREALCRTEASAEDLLRTMTLHEDVIRSKISKGHKRKMNGNHKEKP